MSLQLVFSLPFSYHPFRRLAGKSASLRYSPTADHVLDIENLYFETLSSMRCWPINETGLIQYVSNYLVNMFATPETRPPAGFQRCLLPSLEHLMLLTRLGRFAI
jgi:hypothetical protein